MTLDFSGGACQSSPPVLVVSAEVQAEPPVSILDALDLPAATRSRRGPVVCSAVLRMVAVALGLGAAGVALMVISNDESRWALSRPVATDGGLNIALSRSQAAPRPHEGSPLPASVGASTALIENGHIPSRAAAPHEREWTWVLPEKAGADGAARAGRKAPGGHQQLTVKQKGSASAAPRARDAGRDRDVDIIEVIVGSGKAGR